MTKFSTTLLAAFMLFGAPHICMGDYEDVFPEMQNEEQLDAQAQAREEEKEENQSRSCQKCCKHRRWKKDRFLENQYRETGWPARRDELSDQLSR